MKSFLHRLVSYAVYRQRQRVRLGQAFHGSLLELLALLSPQKARGLGKTRIGAGRDGGYVMLDDFTKVDLAVSLGIGPDVSWDFELAQRGIPVRQYDHTVDAPPKSHPLFQFEPQRIVGQETSENGIPLASLLREQAGKQIVMKMDIEGDEWPIFAGLEPGLLAPCRQIVVEFHDFLGVQKPTWCRQARQALLVLAHDFGVVHIHGNNLSKHILLDDLTLPDSLEVTFANRRFYSLEDTDETFPGPLDQKNNVYFPDFRLGRFKFQPAGEEARIA